MELEDCNWLPRSIRDGGTDFLNFFFARIGYYQGVIPILFNFLHHDLRAEKVLDLASGGGGGTLELLRQMRVAGNNAEFVFSDRFPNRAGVDRVAELSDPRCSYLEEPVDALDGGGEHVGVRTMSGALHHFPPELVATILQSVIRRGEAFAFLDVAALPLQRRLPWPVAAPLILINMTDTIFYYASTHALDSSLSLVPFGFNLPGAGYSILPRVGWRRLGLACLSAGGAARARSLPARFRRLHLRGRLGRPSSLFHRPSSWRVAASGGALRFRCEGGRDVLPTTPCLGPSWPAQG